MQSPRVVSIVLNTDRKADTIDCLRSLRAQTYLNHSVLVLDNQSTDGSVEAITQEFPDVTILHLLVNLGYAGNNNVGIRAALERGADWVFLLNEDTVLHDECIRHLVAQGESAADIGVVGPLVYHHDEPTVIQSGGGILGGSWDSWHIAQNERDIGQVSGPSTVDFISGCAIMVRRHAVEQVGTIDERFFYYKEETEWCYRIRASGWRVFLVPNAKVWHKGVQRVYEPKPSLLYYKTRNWFLFMRKHRAPLRAWLGASLLCARTVLSWSVRQKWRSKREHRDAMLRGVRDFILCRWGRMRS